MIYLVPTPKSLRGLPLGWHLGRGEFKLYWTAALHLRERDPPRAFTR